MYSVEIQLAFLDLPLVFTLKSFIAYSTLKMKKTDNVQWIKWLYVLEDRTIIKLTLNEN
jgi:hypothetical protein